MSSKQSVVNDDTDTEGLSLCKLRGLKKQAIQKKLDDTSAMKMEIAEEDMATRRYRIPHMNIDILTSS